MLSPGSKIPVGRTRADLIDLGKKEAENTSPVPKDHFHFLERRDDKNINFGLEKFFGRRMETRNKIEKDKRLIKHINALGGIENTFDSTTAGPPNPRNEGEPLRERAAAPAAQKKPSTTPTRAAANVHSPGNKTREHWRRDRPLETLRPGGRRGPGNRARHQPNPEAPADADQVHQRESAIFAEVRLNPPNDQKLDEK